MYGLQRFRGTAGVFAGIVCLVVISSSAAAYGIAEPAGRIIGSGRSTTETRNISGFTKIVVAGSGDAVVTPGTRYHVSVIADDNLLPYITTDVEGGTLVLGKKPNMSYRTSSRIRYEISLPELVGVQISGSGNCVINATAKSSRFDASISGSGSVRGPVNVGALTVGISGSGNINLSGRTDREDVRVSGSGTVDCRSLRANSANVSIGGSGDVWLVAHQSLDGTISGSGTLHYSGQARPNVRASGSGGIRSF